MSDVNDINGPYTYYEGSQALTMQRAKHEYVKSKYKAIEKTKWDRIPSYYKFDTEKKKRIIVPDELINSYKKIEFKNEANTLIVSDNFGFHHRGEFEHHGERFLLLINYRRAENSSIRNFLNK